MFRTFLVSYKLKTTYMINIIIYSLKQIPLIGKTISDKCYTDKTLRAIGYVISILKVLIWDIFLRKLIYFVLMFIMIPALLGTIIYDVNLEELELTIPILTTYVFLTTIGGIMNNEMFDTGKDRYYAIFTMKVDAKKYIIVNFITYLIKTMIGMLLVMLTFTVDEQMSRLTLFLLPIYLACTKIIGSWISIENFKRTEKVTSGKLTTALRIMVQLILFITAYALPFLNIEITENIFYIVLFISIILAIKGTIEIFKFDDYKRIYKVREAESADFQINTGEEQTKALKEQVHNQIEIGEKIESKKRGYAFFNELFMRRHKKIVGKAIRIESLILLAIVIIVIGILVLIRDPEMTDGINGFLLRSLPYFTLIMFWMNRSTVITQAMYMNCDHSMLTYHFYRTPKAILGLFKERLKTLVWINLIPSGIVAIALPIILLLSGGTDNPLNYLILFVSIIAMSIFFSTHYLVIYYLLQPYTKDSELKGGTYKIVQTLTIIACYIFSDIKMDTTVFGLAMIAFCIAYILIAMLLVYKKAPKTFKIRN